MRVALPSETPWRYLLLSRVPLADLSVPFSPSPLIPPWGFTFKQEIKSRSEDLPSDPLEKAGRVDRI